MSQNTTCRFCGRSYPLTETFEYDTWNLGNYGCTLANCPKIHKGWEDHGCPHCNGTKPNTRSHAAEDPRNVRSDNHSIIRFMERHKITLNEKFFVDNIRGNPTDIEGLFYIGDDYRLHRPKNKPTSESRHILMRLLDGSYTVRKQVPLEKGPISLNFKGVGGPTEKMVNCISWICDLFPMRQDLDEFDENIWWDYKLASKFIGANIERAQDKASELRESGVRSYRQGGKPWDDFGDDWGYELYDPHY